MIGFSLSQFVEVGWDRQGGAFVGRVLANSNSGDIRFAGRFIVGPLAFEILILNSAPARIRDGWSVLNSMPIEGQAIRGLDREFRHLKMHRG